MVMNEGTTNGRPHASHEVPAANGARPPSSKPSSALLLVGTFRSPALYTLTFESAAAASCGTDDTTTTNPVSSSSSSLSVSHKSAAVGGHSWLALSPSKTNLYTTCWTSPPTVAAYAIHPENKSVTLLNTAPVASLSGYVAVTPSGRHLISVGGPTGEVFRLLVNDDDEDDDEEPGPASSGGVGSGVATPLTNQRRKGGQIGPLVQTLNFREGGGANDGKREGVAHGGFGGLRWGSHSVDVAPDGRAVYVADIGHNCIWTYCLNEEDDDKKKKEELLTLGTKHISPRGHDGPRHAWPHPSGRVLYVVQEHSSMVDAFAVADDGVTLEHLEGYTILPGDKKCEDFWADEVRTSNLFSHHDATTAAAAAGSSTTTTTTTRKPRYLYGSTRGLQPERKGYVAAYNLDPEGRIQGPAVDIYETRTSGGLANAVEPAPAEVSRRIGSARGATEEEEFIALTDSEEGWIVILGWNGKRFREVAATRLGDEEDDNNRNGEEREVVQAATAVWL